MEALGHRAEHFAQSHRLRRGQTDRVAHAHLVEAQHLAGGDSGAEHAGGAGGVPADLLMCRRHRSGDAALRLDAQHHGVDEVAAAEFAVFRQRQQRRDNGCGRVHRRGQVGVVEVEHVRADAVQQRGVHGVEPLLAAEQAGLRRAGKRGYGGECDLHRLMPRAADGDTHPVQQRARHFLAGGLRQVLVARRDQVAREGTGHILRLGASAGAADAAVNGIPVAAVVPAIVPATAV